MGTDTSGKRENQKLKPYIVLQILQRETDENHVLSAMEIAAALELLGIDAERRSIYRDIEEINMYSLICQSKVKLPIKNLLFIGSNYRPINRRYSLHRRKKFIAFPV